MSVQPSPERIWLQLFGDEDQDDMQPNFWKDTDITWCWERIYKDDVEYVLASRNECRFRDPKTNPEKSGWYFVRLVDQESAEENDWSGCGTEYYDAEKQWWCGSDVLGWMPIPEDPEHE